MLNEDRVRPSNGFGTHPHQVYEIFSYVVSGALRHKDSLGNDERIARGDVQFTSAGTGMAHSEFNDSNKELVHFLQMWVRPVPEAARRAPACQTGHFPDAEKLDRLRLIVSSDGADKSLRIQQDMRVYALLLRAGQTTRLPVRAGREYLVHVVDDVSGFESEANQTALRVNGTLLGGGDAAFLRTADGAAVAEGDELEFTGAGAADAAKPVEFLVFDTAKESKGADSHADDFDDDD